MGSCGENGVFPLEKVKHLWNLFLKGERGNERGKVRLGEK